MTNGLFTKTTRTYLTDLAERVIWTALAAAAGVVLAASPHDPLDADMWQTAGAAGLAAAVSLVKGLLARYVGDPNSASSATQV